MRQGVLGIALVAALFAGGCGSNNSSDDSAPLIQTAQINGKEWRVFLVPAGPNAERQPCVRIEVNGDVNGGIKLACGSAAGNSSGKQGFVSSQALTNEGTILIFWTTTRVSEIRVSPSRGQEVVAKPVQPSQAQLGRIGVNEPASFAFAVLPPIEGSAMALAYDESGTVVQREKITLGYGDLGGLPPPANPD